GVCNYFSDPAFRAELEETPEENPYCAIFSSTKIFDNSALTWEEIEFVKEHIDLPIILTGIVHHNNATKALIYIVDSVIVSNHGGRQVDGGIAALDALPEVCDVIQNKIPVLMDSGIRRGSDVIKAMALGADAVLVGRPLMYGLAVSGQQGVKKVLNN